MVDAYVTALKTKSKLFNKNLSISHKINTLPKMNKRYTTDYTHIFAKVSLNLGSTTPLAAP